MRTAHVTITGISPYSQSKVISAEKLPKERPDDYEKRCWRERIHSDASGAVYIPPMAFKNALSECAKYLSIQIPGKGKSTYTKHFEAGVMIMDPVYIGSKKDDAIGEWIFVPSDGKRGGGTRVFKCFPAFPEWGGVVIAHVLDDTITNDVFDRVFKEAGSFIGVGRFRPRNNGYYGRFEVKGIEWQ